MERVLVIEDSRAVADAVVDVLVHEGFRVSVAYSGQEGIKSFLAESPDLVILDLVLPDMHGFKVFREIRRRSDVPVVMLTARSELSDRIAGIELGADDYLPKPVSADELVARVRVVLHCSRLSHATGDGQGV